MLFDTTILLGFPFAAGCMASAMHVLMGPDHLAAVTPFALERKRAAWKIGLSWGLGHLAGMLLIGILFLQFREWIPVEEISAYSERLVGLVLVLIGIWAFYKIFYTKRVHEHLHVHAEEPRIHKHPHRHEDRPDHEHQHSNKDKQSNLASFFVGVLHGFAGIAHFILFLPVASFETQGESLRYILGFILGILLAMTLFTYLLGRIASFSGKGHRTQLFRGIQLAGGIAAVVIGLYWMSGPVVA